ncbi:MAG: alpha-L-fucosidase [Ignavibacteria bacterium]|nr:alpha-L-fucosidase [Ignavibacteria bacterium]
MNKIIKSVFVLVLMVFAVNIQGLYSQSRFNLSKGRNFLNDPINPRRYNLPDDSLVNLNLKKWQGYKFGVLITWGVYTQWGIIDSWTLCSNDVGWNHRTGPYADDYDDYKKQYEKIYYSFNPANFYPDVWAEALKNAGVKYLLVMTKHLDGFCMYNTATTDYRITSPNCPFHTNTKSNIAFEICKAARKKGISVGAYFSKPDWNSNYFWWRYFGVTWIDVNYNTSVYPDKWNQFKSFTYNQLDEITKNLGKLDILWLDGPWVKPGSNMDIDMPSIAANVRKNQPGMLIVDRSCEQYEDYLTPEYDIPAEPLGVPFEVVRTLGSSRGHVTGGWYFTADTLVHTLIEVVAKGGNLLYSLGPDSDGVLDPQCYDRLQSIGEWMNVNSSAIYETSYTSPFKRDNIYFTSKKDTIFAIYMAYNNEQKMPSTITIHDFVPKLGSDIYLLGYEYPLSWYTHSEGITTVNIPYEMQSNPPCSYAWTLKFINKNNGPVPGIPEKYDLSQNYPNPFNPVTKIDFSLPMDSKVKITVYDILGKEIKVLFNDARHVGYYTISFDASNLSSGIYFYKISAISGRNEYVSVKKMIFLK